jgi:hypothetical protein
MAEFRVPRFVLEEGRLPMICMCCGAPAVTTRTKFLTETPGWLLLILACWSFGGAIRATALASEQDRCFVVAPFCAWHKNHWTNQVLWPFLVLASGASLCLMCIALEEVTLGVTLVVISVPVTLVMAAICRHASIHASVITEDGVILNNVSHRFLEALEPNPAAAYRRLDEQESFRQDTRPEDRS